MTKLNFKQRLKLFCETLGFKGIKSEVLEVIADMSFSRLYARGEYIFHEGDSPDYFHVVDKGRVKVSISTPDGKNLTAIVAVRGDTLNAVALFENMARFLTAQAMDETTVVQVKRDDFVSFVYNHPDVALNIIAILGRLIHSSYERALGMVDQSVEQRVVNVLFMLFLKFGKILKFTNREIADLAGTTTETTIRVMRSLRQSGSIKSSRGQIEIIDHAGLKRLSKGYFLI